MSAGCRNCSSFWKVLRVRKTQLNRIKLNEDKVRFENSNESANSNELLKRVQSNSQINVWLLVDDIDATYIDSEQNRLFISTFFTACRILTQNIKGVNIRASVRTDVWSLLASTDESLDKCEQYMYDLKWSTKDTQKILLNKIKAFINSYNDLEENFVYSDYNECYKNIFQQKIGWETRSVHPLRVIHILSAGRPRWASQLCKLAAKDAYTKGQELISNGNINFAMNEYGRKRLQDLNKEHSHQCNKIAEIIESFRNGPSEYRYNELIAHIKNRIL
jgi:hypothetical protein